jgi:hypothetical protein
MYVCCWIARVNELIYNLYITRDWLTSDTARAVFLVSAVFSAFFFIGVLGLGVAFATSSLGEGTLLHSPSVTTVIWLLLFPGVLGTAIIWVAMWYFWFIFHPAERISSSLWFVVLWLGPPGALVYFFCVYLRSARLQLAGQQQVVSGVQSHS